MTTLAPAIATPQETTGPHVPSPAIAALLEQGRARRARAAALPFAEKLRILAQLRDDLAALRPSRRTGT